MNSIQHLLYASMQVNADRTAILDAGDGGRISYSALFESSSRAAGYLRSIGVQPGDRVVIALQRSVSYIVTELACLLFGYGAVLMDTNAPAERIAYAAKEANAKQIIDPAFAVQMLEYPHPAEYRQVPVTFPAVILYTSGSTGKPKGILHDQLSLGNAVCRNWKLMEPVPGDIEGLTVPFTFVAGCTAALNSLCAGACVTIIPREVTIDPPALAEFIHRMGVTLAYIPPGVLKHFQPISRTLRRVITGSERISGLAPYSFPVYNIYGMSETGPVTRFRIDRPYDNTPIGCAIEGCAVYLLDEYDHKAQEGEICIAGHFMTGYIGMPEKTAQTKVKNPFFREDGYETMIRTGDLGRLNEKGDLVCINRKDWMLKINGQRVEPGEIEAVIKRLPQITDAIVKGFTNAEGQSYLCAYYMKNAEIPEEYIRLAIERQLPSYMMPAYFVELDAIPLNPNGKRDRLALQPPDLAQFTSDYAAPTNPTEEQLCRSMAKILGMKRVGIHDDFFRLGGNSIGCMSLITQLDDPRIGTGLVYRYKTPASIAAALDGRESEDRGALSRIALTQDQPLIPYQVYYLDYQSRFPLQIIANQTLICSIPKEQVDVRALKEATDRVLHHFAIFGTVFLRNEAKEPVQRYCPERIPEIEIIETNEADFHSTVRAAFVRPFRMLDSLLWRSQIAVTEKNVYLMLDFHHAITDGTMTMCTFRQIFEVLNGRELQDDCYYLFLQRQAEFLRSPEALSECALLSEIYDGSWSKFPKPDFDSCENSNRRVQMFSSQTAEAYRSAAANKGISLGTALVTAGQLALSRFNQESRVAVEWIYNGRNEKWKEDLVGITISGIPAAMDFSIFTDNDSILAEARRQNELGLRYADHSFAVLNMRPTTNEYLKIVYEHGIDVPENVPADWQILHDTDHYTGMLALLQIIIFEGKPDAPLSLFATYQGTRYRDESIQRLLTEFAHGLDELIL